MNVFSLFFRTGMQHILDLQGYDHILFLLALVAVYKLSQVKPLLILITAFTLGHSFTLVLATLSKDVLIPTEVIEFLIPITIVFTAVHNIANRERIVSGKHHLISYGLTFIFGLIHGLGFSNYLQELLMDSGQMVKALFAFNLGIETGQLLFVSFVLLFIHLLIKSEVKHRESNLVVSGATAGIALIMCIERFPW
jgi:hypothetical protein